MIPILEWNGDAEGMSKAAKTVPFSPMRGESVTFRNTLDSPFRLSWPDITKSGADRILTELKSALRDVCLPMEKTTRRRKQRSSVGNEVSAPSRDSNDPSTPPAKRVCLGKVAETLSTPPESGACSEGSTVGDQRLMQAIQSKVDREETDGSGVRFNKVKRSQIVVGSNAVTRQLERGALRAGLVCPSARPPLVHRNLLMMAATRGIPFAAVPRLSETITPLLGLKTALAVGFKKPVPEEEDHFCGLLTTITAVAPPISIPWLSTTIDSTAVANSLRASVHEERATEGGVQPGKVDPERTHKSSPAVTEGAKAEMGVAKSVDPALTTTPHHRRFGRKRKRGKAGLVTMTTPTVEYHPLQIKRVTVRAKRKKRK